MIMMVVNYVVVVVEWLVVEVVGVEALVVAFREVMMAGGGGVK